MVYSSILILLPAHKLIDFIRHDTTATLACSSTPAPSWNRLAAAVASVCRRAVNSVEVITNNFGQQLDQTSPTNFCLFFFQAIAEDCSRYILSALKLATVLDCDQFPQSNDPNVCLNLASTSK